MCFSRVQFLDKWPWPKHQKHRPFFFTNTLRSNGVFPARLLQSDSTWLFRIRTYSTFLGPTNFDVLFLQWRTFEATDRCDWIACYFSFLGYEAYKLAEWWVGMCTVCDNYCPSLNEPLWQFRRRLFILCTIVEHFEALHIFHGHLALAQKVTVTSQTFAVSTCHRWPFVEPIAKSFRNREVVAMSFLQNVSGLPLSIFRTKIKIMDSFHRRHVSGLN